MWRDLTARINSGLGHEEKAELQPGGLAIFCPACPQPGINLSKEWDQDPKRYIALTPAGNSVLIVTRWLYTRSIVIDGNFSAEHLKMRQPEEDIALSPGGRYMVEPERYELHLSTGKEIKQVCPFRMINCCTFNNTSCRNLYALTTRQSIMSILPKHILHPQELVPLPVLGMDVFFPIVLWISRKGKGKWCNSHYTWKLDPEPILPRQLNIDYAVCQSLMTIPPDLRVITIYDVACQWNIHFQERVGESPYLGIPKGITLVPAVGKWHLGAHVPECFPKYSLNFVDGIGQIDGEILETLWWPIDKVAGITRAMSKAHRQEVLDDNMYDSNWKKWVGIGESSYPILSRVATKYYYSCITLQKIPESICRC
jgi:hypothetical protein